MNIRDTREIEEIRADPIAVFRGDWDSRDGEWSREGWLITLACTEPDPDSLEWSPNADWEFTGEVVSVDRTGEDELVIHLDRSTEFAQAGEIEDETDEDDQEDDR